MLYAKDRICNVKRVMHTIATALEVLVGWLLYGHTWTTNVLTLCIQE